MGANLSRASQVENVSTTLSAGITDVATSMDVGDATKLNYPSYLVIDRVDAAGTLKSTSLWEYVKVTNIVGGTLTITRAQGGSTQQAHSSGAVVEAVMTAALQEEYYNAFNPEHTAIGGHIMSQATIASLENKKLAITSVCSIVYAELRNLAVSSVASIAVLNSDNLTLVRMAISSIASISTLYVPTNLNASGASISGSFLSSKVISGTRDSAAGTGDIGYTGVGFKPTSIVCFWNVDGTTIGGWGVADSAKANMMLYKDATNFYTKTSNLVYYNPTGGDVQSAIVKSFDADGFTLTWTKASSPTGTIALIFLCYR